MISLKSESAHIAGDYLRYSTKCPLKVILKRCPNINTVRVQNSLSEKRLRCLEKIEHITDLSIPSCLLHLYAPSIDRLLCQPRLKQLHILQRYDTIKTLHNMLRMPYAIRISKLPLTIFEMSGVVLKWNVLKVICEGLRVTLQELLICGSLCNSPDFDDYISAIAILSNLKMLEMPPSMFSLCHRKIPNKLALIGQLPLKGFSIYVHYYNAPNIALLLTLLPKTLKELIVYRTTEFDSNIWEKDFGNTTFKVYFCHLNDIVVEHDWMCGNNELLTHTLWLPPYKYSYSSQRFDPVEWYENIFEQIKDDDEWNNVEVLRTALELSETEITNQLTLTTAAWDLSNHETDMLKSDQQTAHLLTKSD